MLTGPNVILTLKIAVAAVTLLLLASLTALAAGRRRLHGRINFYFLVLTLTAVLGLEVLIRFVKPDVFDYFDDATRRALRLHLWFSVPAAVLLPVMYVTGRAGRGRLHLALATVFAILWVGTFVTGIFFLPN
ncbi:MAG TPA: hypothetical protein VH120_13840 [Gemmataceae bacterium]|nr:hypothetical protein [Gemmataceae bacterium]